MAWFYPGSLGHPASRSILTCWSVSPTPTQYFKGENHYSKESHPMVTGCTLNLGTFHWTERMLFNGREEIPCELPLQVHQTPPPATLFKCATGIKWSSAIYKGCNFKASAAQNEIFCFKIPILGAVMLSIRKNNLYLWPIFIYPRVFINVLQLQ